MTTLNADDDFRQFARSLDLPVSPSSHFTERLRSQLQDQPSGSPTHSTTPTATAFAVSKTNAAPSLGPIIGTQRFPARISRTMRVAAAMLALLVAISAFALTLQPNHINHLAFQPSESPITEFNTRGDAGQTGNLGRAVPHTQSLEQRQRIPTEQGGIWGPTLTGNIDSNSIFLVDPRMDGQNAFFRYDLERQTVVWERDFNVPSNIASDGQRVYVVTGDNSSATTQGQLVALDIRTGETVWEGPMLADRFTLASTVVISDRVVYASDYVGNVVAVDATDGKVIWQVPNQYREPTLDERGMIGTNFPPPQLVVNNEFVYVTPPSRSIVQIDRHSGIELATLPILDTYGAEVYAVSLMATDDVLIAQLFRPERMVDPEFGRGQSPSDMLILDPTILDTRHHFALTDTRGNPVLHNDLLFLPTQNEAGGTVILMVNIVTGETTNSIDYVQTRWDTNLSISGGVLMATGDPTGTTDDPVGIWFINAATGEQVGHVELGELLMENPFEFPVLMWNDQPLIITFVGEVFRITNDTPGTTPQASPTPP